MNNNEKIDLRIRYTKRAIRESILDLLDKKPINKITVKEICEGAQINRATFYSHYENLPCLLEEIIIEKSQELAEALDKMYEGQNYFEQVLDGILNYFKHDSLMCTLLLGDKIQTSIPHIYLDKVKARSISHWMEVSTISLEQASWIFDFFTVGIEELIRQWYLSGFEAETSVLKMTINNIVTKGLDGFIYSL